MGRKGRRSGFGPIGLAAVAALVPLATGACGSAAEREPRPPPESPVRILEYNVKAQSTLSGDPARGARIAAQVAEIAPALVGLSECSPCQELVDQLPGEYELVADDRAGVAAAYDASIWRANDRGFLTLGQNDDGWGERVALWAELEEIGSGGLVFFYSTHWCVEHRRPDDRCDVARQLEYAEKIIDHAGAREPSATPVIVTGDLNVREGSPSDVVLDSFAEAGYVDALRAIHATGEIITLDEGFRVDYVFASQPVDVLDAYVDQTVPFELGSDHWPVVSTLQLH